MKRLLAVTAMTLSVMGLTSASAGAAAEPSGELHLTKDCSTYTGAAGDICTVTASSLEAIEVGSKILYLEAAAEVDGVMTLESDILIDAPGNNTALGHVTLNLADGTGTVEFSGGTGAFTNFQASGDVSPGETPNFMWDGEYSFPESGQACVGSSAPPG